MISTFEQYGDHTDNGDHLGIWSFYLYCVLSHSGLPFLQDEHSGQIELHQQIGLGYKMNGLVVCVNRVAWDGSLFQSAPGSKQIIH